MLLYRYRSGSELSLKELIYDEIFFASTSECNDPYEGKAFVKLAGDRDVWDRLIRTALKSHPIKRFDDQIRNFADYFAAKSPLYVGELLAITANDISSLGKDAPEKLIYPMLLECIKQFIMLYIPTEQYFVSFSKGDNNMLMWSHYANNHRGYCLVFRIADRKLQQSPFWKRTSVSYDTPRGIAPHMSFPIEESFLMQDIEYVSEPVYVDGLMCLPPYIIGYTPTQDAIDKHRHDFSSAYLQKHSVWDYEKEVRILLSSGIPWLTGRRLSLSPHQRLFHYDSTQLVGIVFGARMPKDQRKRIREIIHEKEERWHINRTDEMILSDFVFFEECLSESNRSVNIVPIEILTCTSSIKKDNSEFERRYQNWKDGWALHFSGSSCSRIQII